MKLLWCAGPQALICICMTGSSIRVIIHLCQAECWFWSKKSGEIVRHKSKVWFNSVYNPFFFFLIQCVCCILYSKAAALVSSEEKTALCFFSECFVKTLKETCQKHWSPQKTRTTRIKTLFHNRDCPGSKCRPFKWLGMHLYLLSFNFLIAWWKISKQKKK